MSEWVHGRITIGRYLLYKETDFQQTTNVKRDYVHFFNKLKRLGYWCVAN